MEIIKFHDIKEKYHFMKEYNNEYIITESGKVYSFKNNKLKLLSQSLCSKNKYNKGYYKCTLSVNNKKCCIMPHRIVAKYFLKNPNNYNIVNHKDGDTLNNHYRNLEWLTQKDNLIDANKRNNQTFKKWCYMWRIIYPNGEISKPLAGKIALRDYILDNKLECKYSMLLKHKQNKGYKLIIQ